jgi:8-oxo-dGTP diphosphatase
VKQTIYVNWGGQNVKLTWMPSAPLPNLDKVTSVHGFCFYQNKILLVHVKGRGFNIPGGHVEPGESPEQAFHREAFEEGCVKGQINYLGMIEVNHEENPLFDPDGKYPLIGYQLFYRMEITQCFPFSRRHETVTRIWVEPEEIPYVINDHALILQILDEALKMA